MASKITYKEAIETLQAMFSTLDEETLKSVLVMNKGLLEPTIECLLKLSGEEGGEDQQKSMFNPGGGEEFNDDPFYLNSLQKNQEDQDRALAYKLQKKYMYQANAMKEEEKYYEGQQQQKPKKKSPIKGPRMENNEEPEPYQNEEGNMENNEEDDLHVNNKPFKKEKKSFKEKMKSAKESFFNIFKKKKKTNNNSASNIQDNKGKPQEIIAFEEEEDNDVILLPPINQNPGPNPNQPKGNNLYPDLNH